MSLLQKLFGSNEKQIKRLQPLVDEINALEDTMTALTDEAMVAKTRELQKRVQAGESLDALLPEAFALTREAAQRAIGQRHYDVQLVGGIV